MASRGSDAGRHLPLQPHHHHHHHTEPAPEPAVREAQRWIEVRDVMPLRYLGIQCLYDARAEAVHAQVSAAVCRRF